MSEENCEDSTPDHEPERQCCSQCDRILEERDEQTEKKFDAAMESFEKKLELAAGDESEESPEMEPVAWLTEMGMLNDKPVYSVDLRPRPEHEDYESEPLVRLSDVIDCVEAHLARYEDKAKTYDRDALAARDALNDLLEEITQNGGTE